MGFDELAQELTCEEGLLVAGVLSGTSADGIDVGFVRLRFCGEAFLAPRLVAFATRPFPADLGQRLHAALAGEAQGLRQVALLDRDLGLAFGEAVQHLRLLCPKESPRLIASHGQTLWHHDGVEESGSASLQLGDPSRIAARTGLPVVSGFRAMDLALGGEGAPLSAWGDEVIFAAEQRPFAVLNLGGIANLTFLGRRGPPLAFDTGPAGALLDHLARTRLRQPMDPGGVAASRGQSQDEVRRLILDHPSIGMAPPCSTGRDAFGPAWLAGLDRALLGVATKDLLASAADAIACHVAGGLEHLPERPERLLVAGGGVHHRPLMTYLERRTGLPVLPSSKVGVDPDARESLVFAVLGARFLLGLPSTCEHLTGARTGGILGSFTPAPLPR